MIIGQLQFQYRYESMTDKKGWTIPKLRVKCQELNYTYTQEGEEYYVNGHKFKNKEQLLNWFKYHIWFDV
jgi:hypothetical protein